jgi:hypothetical protein
MVVLNERNFRSMSLPCALLAHDAFDPKILESVYFFVIAVRCNGSGLNDGG